MFYIYFYSILTEFNIILWKILFFCFFQTLQNHRSIIDMFVLLSNKLQKIYCFVEQEIDLEALLCLNENNLKEIIPKIGPRMKFFSKLNRHQELASLPIVISDECIDTVSNLFKLFIVLKIISAISR